MIVDRVAGHSVRRQRFEKFFTQPSGPLDSGIDVITLLEVDVLE
jgi:hypothetical protein